MLSLGWSIVLYMSVMLWTGIFMYIAKKRSDNKLWHIGFDILAAFPLFFIMAFRYDVGTDYFHGYIPHYTNIANGLEPFSHERGFYYIYKVLQVFTMQSQSIIIVTSFIYVFFLIWAVDEQTCNPIIAIAVLFLMTYFSYALNNIRQQIAVIICFWAFRFVKKGEFAPYLATIITCMFFFHTSCIIMLAVYPISNIKFIRKYCYIWMPLLILMTPLIVKLFFLGLDIFGYDYANHPSFQAPSGNFFLLMQNLILFGVLLLAFKKEILKDKVIFTIFAMQFLALEISIMTYGLKMLEIPERIATYFMIFQMISIPLAIFKLFKWNRNICMFATLLILWVMVRSYYTLTIVNNFHEIMPYQFVFGHWEELIVKKANYFLNLV